MKLFNEIVKKIVMEMPPGFIDLFNWGEPFLHPELPAFVQTVKKHGMRCRLSSNFNAVSKLEEVLREKPDYLRISLSGYDQQTYSQTHKKGNVNVVKSNMLELRMLMNKLNSAVHVAVAYHRYIHNVGENHLKVKELCKILNFNLEAVWAYLMPLEKLLAYYEGTLPEKDLELVNLLVIRPEESKQVSMKYKTPDCNLRRTQMAINVDGSVALCCVVYDQKYTIAQNFLDKTFAELQNAKYTHPMCSICMSHAAHTTYQFGGIHELYAIATNRLSHLND
ncbi:MoaA/NifB/PqqE/SkfB family radical SAM enzyme [Peptococcaceae bacterium DYL19]|nr:MoaA/NifB/PqqE/SkfB family radical SAM enzyme [Phosphitispora fastidiosa]